MTASIPTHPGLDHHTPDSDPTAAWSPVPQAYSQVAPADDDPIAPRYYGNGPVIAALLGAGLACAALGLVLVDNIASSSPRTVAVAPGAATGPAAPANAFAPGVGADFVKAADAPAPPAPVAAPPPAPVAAPLPDPAPVVAAVPPALGFDSPPPPPPPPPPADGPADPAVADPGVPPPAPSGPVVVVNVPMVPILPPPPVVKLPPPPPPVVKPLPPPVIPLPIVKLPPPPAPGPPVCLPPHHLVAGHCQ